MTKSVHKKQFYINHASHLNEIKYDGIYNSCFMFKATNMFNCTKKSNYLKHMRFLNINV